MSEKKEERKIKKGPRRRRCVCQAAGLVYSGTTDVLCGGQGGGSVLPFLASRFVDGDGHMEHGDGDRTRLVANATAGEHRTPPTTNVRWCTTGALRRTLYNESKKVKRENV